VILGCVLVHGFLAYLVRSSGFMAKTGSGSFGVGADGLVIEVGFDVSGLFRVSRFWWGVWCS
jgi:hypothetical protein